MGYYTKSYRSTEWIKIHFYDERNRPKVKHWISKKIYGKVKISIFMYITGKNFRCG